MITSLAAMPDHNAAPADPLPLFLNWLAEAEKSEPYNPNAMCMATVDKDNQPQVRTLLLKGIDERGFVFYTNTQSCKGEELRANPRTALCFYWKSLRRQVRVNGMATLVSAQEADAYFATRPHGSQIGAWASEQSRPLEDRQVLADRIAKLEQKYAADMPIPRPPHWSGYRLCPSRIEFWEEGDFRLHTRLAYWKSDDTWQRTLLYP